MAELVGGAAIGAVLGVAASEALASIKSILRDFKHKTRNLKELEAHLHSLTPFVEELKSTTSLTGALAVPAWEWVNKLERELQAAEELLVSLRNSTGKHVLPGRKARILAKINNNISDLRHDAAVAGWASTLLAIGSLAQSQAEDRKVLDEVLELVKLQVSQASASQPSNLRGRNIVRTLNASRRAFNSDTASSSTADGVQFRHQAVKADTSKPKVDFGDQVAEDLIASLTDRQTYTKWLGLWAMGGAGKTFTARKIYNDRRIKKRFNGGQFWTTVSKHGLSSHILLRDLFQQIEGSPTLPEELPNTLEGWKEAVKCLLAHKENVLLIVDDVWESSTLEALDVVSEERKGVILVTTRDEGILRREHAKIVEIPRLSHEHSWQLFSWHAFLDHGRSIPSDLEPIAKDVAAECQRLPLALEVVGSSMRNIHVYGGEKKHGKSLVLEWKKALDRLRGANAYQSENDKLYRRLQLSVEGLSEVDARLQDCLFDVAAFPEDCEIEIEDLLNMWIVGGFVTADVDSRVSSEDEARYLLGLLVAKSMIKLSDLEASSHNKLLPFDDGGYCKVHDVVRDLVRKNLKINFKTNQSIGVHESKCLYASGLGLKRFPELWGVESWSVSRTRSWFGFLNLFFTCFGGGWPTPRFLARSRTRFSAEKLSLSGNNLSALPDFFDAPELRVLILKQNENLKVLPPNFFRLLSSLRVLNLAETGIATISDEVVDNLKALVFLDVRRCLSLRSISHRIKNLDSLETILLEGSFSVSLTPPRNLRTLSGDFDVHNVCEWRSLRSLRLPAASHVEGVSSLADLEVLKATVWAGGARSTAEVMRLRHLRILKLTFLPRWLDHDDLGRLDMPCLGELGQLEVLWIEFERIEQVHFPPSFAERGAFPCLKEMKLHIGHVAECFTFHPGTMPQIESLSIIRSNAPDIPETYKSLRELGSLVCLSLKVKNAQSIDEIFREPKCFPKLETVVLYNDSWGETCIKLPTGIGELPRVDYIEFSAVLKEDCRPRRRLGLRCRGYKCLEPRCLHVKPPSILELEREGRLEVKINYLGREFNEELV